MPSKKEPVAAAGDEHLLTVRQIADYMQVNERTVLKLVNAGSIPGAKIASQWRFKREVIDQWLATQMGGVDTESEGEDADMFEGVPDGAGVPLSDLLDEKSIVAELEAKDKITAIEALAQRAFSNGWLVDKPWFVGAVVEREALASTAMDGGVAFLHTRQRNSTKIRRPFIIVGRSHQGIEFGSPDGKPTHLFFLLGLKYDKLHLPILGRLARILKRPELVRTLRATPTPTRIRDTLLQEDQKALVASAAAAAHALAHAPAPKKTKKS